MQHFSVDTFFLADFYWTQNLPQVIRLEVEETFEGKNNINTDFNDISDISHHMAWALYCFYWKNKIFRQYIVNLAAVEPSSVQIGWRLPTDKILYLFFFMSFSVFRDVSGRSRMFRVPDFMDTRYRLVTGVLITVLTDAG